MKGLGLPIALFALAGGMIALMGAGTKANAASPTLTPLDLQNLRDVLSLKDTTPVTVGNYAAGQQVPAPGVYIDRSSRVVYGTELDGTVLIKSEPRTKSLQDFTSAYPNFFPKTVF